MSSSWPGVPKATTMGYKLQAYLHKNRHGTFAFRWRPPRDVAAQFGQATFVYSLGTKESSIARGRALYASIRANQFVSILRAVKTSKEPIFNTELVRSVIMPDGTEHKLVRLRPKQARRRS